MAEYKTDDIAAPAPTDSAYSPARSRLTVQDVLSLPHLQAGAGPTEPSALRTVVHIDMDAFYAQCEMRRLGLPDEQPLAVRQWHGLIAVNYAAREYGIKRHTSAVEAKAQCPAIVLQHVPTWEVNPASGIGSGSSPADTSWAYRPDSHRKMATLKVSLDPYRRESRKILAKLRQELAAIEADVGPTPGLPPLAIFEKASVDEVFLDLSGIVHASLLRRYPCLAELVERNEPEALLPLPPDINLDWGAGEKVSVVAPVPGKEAGRIDWDDVTIHIAHEFTMRLRHAVRSQLGYSCSAGVARNKMVAKLGSGNLKPGGQTVIRTGAIPAFLGPLKFTQIRMLGGKLGDRLVALLGTDLVADVAKLSLSELKAKLNASKTALKFDHDDDNDDDGAAGTESARSSVSSADQTAAYLYNLVRGIDHSPVNVRTGIKSILSAKIFNQTLPSLELTRAWLQVFVADIHTRCLDEGMVDEETGWWSRTGRRPKTITIHFRQGAANVQGPYVAGAAPAKAAPGPIRSRSAPMSYPPTGASFGPSPARAHLFDAACRLIAQIVAQGRVWPCAYLSVSVSNFEAASTHGGSLVDFFAAAAAATPPVPVSVLVQRRQELVGKDGPAGQPDISTVTTSQMMGYVPDEADLAEFVVPGPAAPERTDMGSGGQVGKDGVIRVPYRGNKKKVAKGKGAGGGKEKAAVTIRSMFQSATARAAPSGGSPDRSDLSGSAGRVNEADSDAVSTDHGATPNSGVALVRSPVGEPADAAECPRCARSVPLSEVAEHSDWHYAKDLADELSRADGPADGPAAPPEPAPLPSPSSRGSPAPPRPPSTARKRRFFSTSLTESAGVSTRPSPPPPPPSTAEAAPKGTNRRGPAPSDAAPDGLRQAKLSWGKGMK